MKNYICLFKLTNEEYIISFKAKNIKEAEKNQLNMQKHGTTNH